MATMRYLVTRTLAYALLHEEGIAFSKGLSTASEPAVWVREGDGRVRVWIEGPVSALAQEPAATAR